MAGQTQRYRSFILTPVGWHKLTQRIRELQNKTRMRYSPRTIADRTQLIHPQGLSTGTVRKILNSKLGVDKLVIDGLLSTYGSNSRLENQLTEILALLQKIAPQESGYAGGNVFNLLALLGTDWRGKDFSHLTVWQADLRHVDLQQVNFAHADLAKSMFAEPLGCVFSVAFSPNGKLLATGDTTGEVRLYQVADGKQLLTCKGHTSVVWSVTFSPDSHVLASGSNDQTVRLWDVGTGECLSTLQEHGSRVWSVAFSPQGTTLASGSDHLEVKLWDISTGRCIKTLQGHTGRVYSVAFSPDGQTLASGSHDQTVRCWDTSTGLCLKTLRGHSNRVRANASYF